MLADTSNALAARMIVIRMNRSFAGLEDPELFDRLAGELSGIAEWAVEGLIEQRERGRFVQPDSAGQRSPECARSRLRPETSLRSAAKLRRVRKSRAASSSRRICDGAEARRWRPVYRGLFSASALEKPAPQWNSTRGNDAGLVRAFASTLACGCFVRTKMRAPCDRRGTAARRPSRFEIPRRRIGKREDGTSRKLQRNAARGSRRGAGDLAQGAARRRG